MADGIRRAMQDIDLGVNDEPFVMPQAVVQQAAAENRFILVGRPVMPRRQNLRAILAVMPHTWGLEGLVRGRITEGRRFQFVFPSEEAMETVIRRGPWSYAERMLVLQRWTPLMDMELLNFIPFWIQIRGIPLQFMNREVIVNVARAMRQQYIQMDYNEENGGRQDFVRVRLNWNINQPLRFQRNFQFTPGVNTLLRFQYERLRGFCELCGLITHDTGACVINNGGPGPGGDDGNNSAEDNDEADDEVEMIPNQGIIIEEIGDEDEVAEPDPVADQIQEEYERNVAALEEENDDDELWNGPARTTMFTSEMERDLVDPAVFNRGYNNADIGLKRKDWLRSANGNASKFEKGETSGTSAAKRLRESPVEAPAEAMEDDKETDDATDMVRGAVGPEPPLPP
ncbi:uncharacterized protein LOC130508511 [Raphanus sativus]|uniref:Uncharacterized protein LOC130508511 n=1 Tax=Raphanus sativus TaxID=3726 RepID=A0A9W3D844_RAPSA|nr:uncharacterized protein LOC130508511 [Raphanus sativus]